jgi:hypothetical protein
MEENLTPEEIVALKQVAKERMAYDIIKLKFKSNWIWAVATGALAVWALWDHIAALMNRP